MAIEVKFFGALRKFGGGVPLEVTPQIAVTVHELRSLLAASMETHDRGTLQALVDVSVFADEERILSDDTEILDGSSVALLPPVCGG